MKLNRWLEELDACGDAIDAAFIVSEAAYAIGEQRSDVEAVEVKDRALKQMATVVRCRLKPGPWPGGKGGE